jgi:hypothetical protein
MFIKIKIFLKVNMSRVLFHIGDAPCHGRRFHDGANDNYADGDPRGLDIDTLLKGIASKNIDYYFAEINDSTVKMIDQFGVILEGHGREIQKVKLASSKDLLETLSSSITSSITASKSLSMHDGHGKPLKSYKVDSSPIDWSPSSEKFEKLKADLYETSFSSGLLDIKGNQVKYEKRSVDIWLAKQPFAKGSVRFAFAALIDFGTSESPDLVRVVMKESIFQSAHYNTMKYCKDSIEVQVVSKLIAEEFMIKLEEGEVKFLDVDLVYVEKTGTYYSMEIFVGGKFKKWTNNFGVVNEDDYSAPLNAFSHWTYQATNEYLIVSDLQGFKSDGAYLLTDPAIICADDWDRFSSTNLAKKGIKKFFQTHKCNQVCEKLKLKKHKWQS